jgi:hypothetical protein
MAFIGTGQTLHREFLKDIKNGSNKEIFPLQSEKISLLRVMILCLNWNKFHHHILGLMMD